MEKKFDIQVSKEHYYKGYDNILRFISYFYQIDIVKKLKGKKILEIGVGNKTVSNYLKESGFIVDTCDFDKELKPDYVADVRTMHFKNNSYNIVMACEVLEHLPWNDFEIALKEMYRVSKKYVVISIPYSSISFEFILKLPLMTKFFRRVFFDFFFRIPLFFKKFKESDQHFWEMGYKNHSIRNVRNVLKQFFDIVEEIRPVLTSYHYFFILKKKKYSKIQNKSNS